MRLMFSRLFASAAVLLVSITASTAAGRQPAPEKTPPAAPVSTSDAFFRVPLSELTLTEGALPKYDGSTRSWRSPVIRPRVLLDTGGGQGECEAFLGATPGQDEGGADEFVRSDSLTYMWNTESAVLVVRAAQGRDITGSLFLPAGEGDSAVRVRFSLPAAKAAAAADAESTKQAFYKAKAAHYEGLLASGAPGSAWFRYQADTARLLAGESARDRDRDQWRSDVRSLDSSYDLFSGGRAVSENLQLHRQLPPPQGRQPAQNDLPDDQVDVSTIPGITVKALDFATLGGASAAAAKLDPLASAIPADQHAVFFSSFDALMRLADEARSRGLPLFRTFEASSQDNRIFERYERQLGLVPSALARALGPAMVRSVAITGSDPYFDTGADVAVLFEAVNAESLRAMLVTEIRNRSIPAGGSDTDGEVEEVKFLGVTTPERRLCSYVAVLPRTGTVVVTNSLTQLVRLIQHVPSKDPAATPKPTIASLPEYKFFRARYTLGDAGETAFIFISDATIRRWCSPAWRIGASRRLRAGAIMADAVAAHAPDLLARVQEEREIPPTVPMRTLGSLTIGPMGISSSVYGTPAFLTPILELAITKVAKDEAAAYARWRDGYQRNWSWAFDPIAVRIGIDKARLSADLSVMPLIVQSQYRTFLSVAQGASIEPSAGDPHDALGHFIIATNPDSIGLKQGGGFLAMLSPDLAVDPLAWMGSSLSLYADNDPFWPELAAAKNTEDFFENNAARMPIGLHVEVSSALKLTAFLTALRGGIEQSSPGMLAWENRKHGEQAYVKVGLNEQTRAQSRGGAFDNLSVYYAATPRALIASINEDVLKRSLDRLAARAKNADGAPNQPDWLGSSACLRMSGQGLDLLWRDGDAARRRIQEAAWSNLEILNEWKRLWPDQDPVVIHERLWAVRLVCPGGGKYTWNEQTGTMESTEYGSPAAPKAGPDGISATKGIKKADFGITFEHDGLRARAIVDRE